MLNLRVWKGERERIDSICNYWLDQGLIKESLKDGRTGGREAFPQDKIGTNETVQETFCDDRRVGIFIT